MPVFKVVVLDCDGVILESVAAKTRAFSRVFERYGEEARQKIVDYHLTHGSVSRFAKFAWFYRQVLGREITNEENEELGSLFRQHCLEEVMNARVVEGAIQFISTRHKKIPLYVASGTPHEELIEIFMMRDLMRFFKGVYGSPPGKTEILADIVRRAGVLPKEALMVGDSSTDLEAAISVGTLFYGRGTVFSDSNWPWGKDLTGLDVYIEKQSNE